MSLIKILVVDDEPGIRSGVSRALRNYSVGYPFLEDDFEFEIMEAATGEEGLDIISRGQIDLVLLDNRLPGMQGVEVLDFIHKNNLDVAVTMITSYASLDLAVDATNKGAYNFVPKPFTPSELKLAVESASKHLYLKRMTKRMSTQGKQLRFKFLSVLSHELKSPLNAIEGYLQLMQDKIMGDDINKYDEMINRSLERVVGMRSLIMDLLDLTKLESAANNKEFKEINITELCNLSIDSVLPLAIQKNIDIDFNVKEPILFTANNSDMDIIFNNLLSNAVKYNRDNGKVFINIKLADNVLIIEVEDTGIGIADEDIDNLFLEFSRIKTDATRYISGSGLGLSILKKTVESYQGSIDVKSEINKGTKFTIKLVNTNTKNNK
jgi:signal transduction histidine kinase